MMRIAITGATRFLGHYLVRQLTADGHQLRCWFREDRRRPGLPDGIEWQKGTLGDPEAAAKLVNGVDAVVHAAVQWYGTPGARRSGDFLDFTRTNVIGSLMPMDAARQAGIGRFIFISSCAVHDRILADRPLDETHPLWPYSHYGAYKAAVEAFVYSLGLGEGWPICALRPTGIYGLAELPSASKWYDLIERVVRGEPIQSARGGKEVHVTDVAKAVAILLAADSKTRYYRVQALSSCAAFVWGSLISRTGDRNYWWTRRIPSIILSGRLGSCADAVRGRGSRPRTEGPRRVCGARQAPLR